MQDTDMHIVSGREGKSKVLVKRSDYMLHSIAL